MKHARLDLARSAELLPTLDGRVAVFGQIETDRLRGLTDLDLNCVSDSFAASELMKQAGLPVSRTLDEPVAHAILFLPRYKAQALHLIAQAVASTPSGWIVVDGQKTDGIESIAKQISKTVPLAGSYSKGHGKTIWFRSEDAQSLTIWQAQPEKSTDDFVTAPGVFSADGIDPASLMLMNNVPSDISGAVADLGAGWGYLSAQLLSKAERVKTLYLVEDNALALDCAKQNIKDERAQFYWADALTWKGAKGLDAIIMNPPFHTTRNAQPALGVNFIKAAANLLRPGGKLYMVANAHLPYEQTLEQAFSKVELCDRSNTFKVFCATRGRGPLS